MRFIDRTGAGKRASTNSPFSFCVFVPWWQKSSSPMHFTTQDIGNRHKDTDSTPEVQAYLAKDTEFSVKDGNSTTRLREIYRIHEISAAGYAIFQDDFINSFSVVCVSFDKTISLTAGIWIAFHTKHMKPAVMTVVRTEDLPTTWIVYSIDRATTLNLASECVSGLAIILWPP